MMLMFNFLHKKKLLLIALLLITHPLATRCATDSSNRTDNQNAQDHSLDHTPESEAPRTITNIIVTGNKLTPTEAILIYVPYKIGEQFTPQRTGELIRNLYSGLRRFRDIKVFGELVGTDGFNLHIQVEEKKILKEVVFEGNKEVTEADISKKVSLDIPAVDEEELKSYAQQIKKIYLERGFNDVGITTRLDMGADGKASAVFVIDEGRKSYIKRILFEGNKALDEKDLRKVLFSREDWILSFLDKSSVFHPDRLDGDKHMIEQQYHNQGFLHAKVIDTRFDINEKNKSMSVTFVIEEGEQYRIGKITAPGNDVLDEEFLLARIPLRSGMLYSQERLRNALKVLEAIWGNQGYIFAHVDPSVEPDEDTKTVNISFFSDIGKKVHLRNLTIKGNKKTRDKIIRRKIGLSEGEPLTQWYMDSAKSGVESLGYFEAKDGVNWKVRRVDEECADLDLVVHEAKTGSFNMQFGFGGNVDIQSPTTGLTVKSTLSDSNLFGSGINCNIDASWAKQEQTFAFHLAQPWLFDRPISGSMDIAHRRPSYDTIRNIDIPSINEKLTTGSFGLGFITSSRSPILNDTQILASFGIDSERYERHPIATISRGVFSADPILAEEQRDAFQKVLNQEFANGDYPWLGGSIEQYKVNHPMHPSRGYKWKFTTRLGLPSIEVDAISKQRISFYRTTLEGTYFTPLIGEYDLVLRLHAFFGVANPFKNRNIPFAELFNIGGPSTVRGYLFGQIGPRYLNDTIGAGKAAFVNAELIFPITPDMNMKGVVFYDGGAGFANPYRADLTKPAISNTVFGLLNNNFDYRHSVGFGIRLLNPMPIKIDWGFKIDPRTGESPYEIHFGMNYDW